MFKSHEILKERRILQPHYKRTQKNRNLTKLHSVISGCIWGSFGSSEDDIVIICSLLIQNLERTQKFYPAECNIYHNIKFHFVFVLENVTFPEYKINIATLKDMLKFDKDLKMSVPKTAVLYATLYSIFEIHWSKLLLVPFFLD